MDPSVDLRSVQLVCAHLFEKITVIENILLQQFGSEIVSKGTSVLDLIQENLHDLKESGANFDKNHNDDHGQFGFEEEDSLYDDSTSIYFSDGSENVAESFPSSKTDRKYKEYRCDLCGVVLPNRQALRDHEFNHTFGEFKCDQCEKVFRTEFGKIAHLKSSHSSESNPFDCNECKETFPTKSSLSLHFRGSHESATIYCHICHICQKGFKVKGRLREHIMYHQKLKRFTCPAETCDSKFYTSVHTRRHLVSFHAWNPKDVPTKIEMDPEFITPKPESESQPKLKIVKRRAPYAYRRKRAVCDVCGSNVLQSGLNAHMRTHDQPLKCEYCEQGFKSLWSLDLHRRRAHTDTDRIFECSHGNCRSRFKSITALRDHMKNHNEAPNYRCVPCGKGYKQRGGLAQHNKIYHAATNTKRFQCRLCTPEKYYVSRHILTRHLRRSHEMSELESRAEAGNSEVIVYDEVEVTLLHESAKQDSFQDQLE